MADPSFDTYSFDPDAGREGAYTFMRADGTARTVANTPYAASLAADIDARKARPAVGLTGSLPMPDPMAGMVRAQQVEAARVAPEFRPAYDALSGSAPLPDLDAFAAKMQALDAPRPAAPRDAGAGLAPEAAQAARAIGTRPPPIDMDALTARLGAIGQPAASQAAPAPMAMAMPEDVMAAETGYRRQGPFDMRRFAVDGAPANGAETPWYDKPFTEGLKSMPVAGPLIRDLSTATRNTARVNFGIGAQSSTEAPASAEAQPTALVSQPPEPGTSEPLMSVAPPAVSQAAVAQAAQQPAPAAPPAAGPKPLAEVKVEGQLPPSARPVGQTANPPQSAGQRIDAQIDKMMAPQFALAQRQGDLSAQAASGEADFAQERAAIGLQRDESDAGRRTTQAGVEQRALADITRAADEVTAKQYDPDRYFKQRGTGAVVLASLAVAMGELGRGLQRTGGPNTALQIVNDAVERDLAAQREEYARAKDKLSLKQNAYAQLRQRGLDDEAASAQARAGALSAVASRAEAFKAGMKTDQAKLDADVTTQKLRDQADGMKAQARAQMAAQAAGAAAAQAAAQQKALKEQLSLQKTAAEIEKLRAEAGESRGKDKNVPDPERLVGLPNGAMVEVKNPTLQTKLAEASPEVSKYVQLTDRIIELSNDPQSRVPGTTANTMLKSNLTSLKLTMKGPAFENLGALAGADLTLIEGVVADPTGVVRGPAQKTLLDGKQRVLTKLDNMALAAGARPVQSEQYQDEQGNIRYSTRYAPGTVLPVAAPASVRKVGE